MSNETKFLCVYITLIAVFTMKEKYYFMSYGDGEPIK